MESSCKTVTRWLGMPIRIPCGLLIVLVSLMAHVFASKIDGLTFEDDCGEIWRWVWRLETGRHKELPSGIHEHCPDCLPRPASIAMPEPPSR